MKTKYLFMKRDLTKAGANLGFSARMNLFSASNDPSLRQFYIPRSPRRSSSEEIGYLQENLTESLTREFAGMLTPHFVKQVVNEASSLAATTPYPELLLPVLAEEKVRKATAWAVKQRRIRQRTMALAA